MSFFPDKNVLKNELNLTFRKIDCLKQKYQKIGNNNIDYAIEIVKCEKYKLDKTITDFHKGKKIYL